MLVPDLPQRLLNRCMCVSYQTARKHVPILCNSKKTNAYFTQRQETCLSYPVARKRVPIVPGSIKTCLSYPAARKHVPILACAQLLFELISGTQLFLAIDSKLMKTMCLYTMRLYIRCHRDIFQSMIPYCMLVTIFFNLHASKETVTSILLCAKFRYLQKHTQTHKHEAVSHSA